MKTNHPLTLLALSLCGSALLLSGCTKSDEGASTATPAGTPAPAPTGSAAGNLASNVQHSISTTTTEMQKQAADSEAAMQDAAAAGQAQVQGLMDKAKSYVAAKKYTDALNTLNELSTHKLTAEQHKWVDDTKAQVQKLVAADVTKGIGGLLGTNK